MSTATLSPRLQIQRRFTRSDPDGNFPRVTGLPGLPANRLGFFWRPIIDMTHNPFAPMRLRIISYVSQWLAEPGPARTSWFAMIGVPGLRHQVLRHAGLEEYECADPTGLAPHLRTPQWSRLAELIDGFDGLDDGTRALVVFQLAQLSFCEFAADLAGPVGPEHNRYAYEVARVTARVPGRAPQALSVFEALAASTSDPRLALLCCAQGIGHSIRSGAGNERAERFEALATGVQAGGGLGDDWHTDLARSRYHRAVALLRLAQRRADDMRTEIEHARHFGDRLYASEPTGADRTVADENRRIILESQIKGAARARGDESAALLKQFCDALYAFDPHCVEALLVIGDGYATAGDFAEAARWYSRAGELGTGAGAIGWYRAGQCLDRIGAVGDAVNAMGHCLDLDTTAVEPRAYLAAH